MKLKKRINNNGSYIVEATITLPIFMIAMIVMCSIISIYSCIEDANYISANDLRRAAAEAVVKKVDIAAPLRIKNQLVDRHAPIEGLYVYEYGYRKIKFGNDEIITLKANLKLNTKNPLGLMADASYDLKTVTRAYVGKERKNLPMSEADFAQNDEAVYIFPKNGEKYHNMSCSFIHSKYKVVTLNPVLKHKYNPCPICKSRKALNGTAVYIFPGYGDNYHLKNCRALERNYIEITKKVAERRGFKPCNKCGG